MVPERNSSLRNYSLTSETATYSSLSSNPFRPQSRHTPSTSVDLTPTVPFFTFTNPSQNNLSMVNSSPKKAQITRSAVVSSSVDPAPAAHKQEPEPVFDMDEYASFSDDSFENPHKPRGEKEKELLFVESVYEFNGSHLPGLPGISDTATSRPTTSESPQIKFRAFHSPSSSVSRESDDDDGDDERHPDLTPYSSQLFESRHLFKPKGFQESSFSHSHPARREGFIEGDESSDDEISFDIPRSRTSTMRYDSTPSRNSRPRYDTAVSPIDGEDDSALDITTLMRRRRDMKTKTRESGPAIRQAQSIKKLNGITTSVDKRSGYMTDVER